jgi:ADP-ribose pyrophosphatase YjhB (NUDIX family)
MKISSEQINAVVMAGLVDANACSDADELHDAAHDALLNEAPVVVRWKAEQDDEYWVVVRGVPGAYFVQAGERNEDGVYSDLAEATNAAVRDYREFFVSDD